MSIRAPERATMPRALVALGLSVAVLICRAGNSRAQSEANPAVATASVIVASAPDVPAGLSARVRGELAAAGIEVISPSQSAESSLWVTLRQASSLLVSELRKGGPEETPLTVVSVAVPPAGAPAELVSAYSELALRTVERIRAQSLRVLVPEPPPATQRSPPAAVAGPAVRAKTQRAQERWRLALSGGGALGLLGQNAGSLARLAFSRRIFTNAFVGGSATLPLVSGNVDGSVGRAAVAQAWGGLELGVQRPFPSGRFVGASLQVGVGRTAVAGSAEPPNLSNDRVLWSAMTTLGVHAGVPLARNWWVQLELAATSLWPRAGVRFTSEESAAAGWIMPAALMGVAASW